MFNRVIVPDFTPRQPHVVQQVGAQIPPPAPVAPPVVAAASPPALKPVYTTLVGDYRQQAPVVVPPPVTLNTQQAAPLLNVGNVAVYTAPYTTVASTSSSGYSPNIETFTSVGDSYFKLASAPSEAADWWQYPAAGPVDMSGNDLNMNGGNINSASGITTSTLAAQSMLTSSLTANTLAASTVTATVGNISTLDTNYISSQIGTISSFSTSIITLDGATLTTAGGSELLLNGIPIATTANLSSLSDWSLDPAISTINANSNNIIGVNDLQVSSINGGNLSSFSAANWWSFPALGTVDISNNALVNVSTINGTVYPPPATGVTSLNAQTGVVALISAGSTVTITNPSPGTINLETAAGSGFVTSVNGAPGAITITSDISTISTSVVGGVTTFSAPTLGVSTDIAVTCFGVANSASLSATSAGLTASAAAAAAAAAQASADAAAITAGVALADATTALAQSGVTFVNGGTFSTTIAAGTGIGVVTTYASGVQNPTITISAPVRQATYYKSANQTLNGPNAPGNTDITFDLSGAWNNTGGYITHVDGTTAFTVVQTGLYSLEFNANIQGTGVAWTGSKQVNIDITRSPIAEQAVIQQSATQNSGTDYGQSVSATFYLVAGDVINLRIFNIYTSATQPVARGVSSTFDLNTFFTWRYISA